MDGNQEKNNKKIEEELVFHLTKDEFKKCRFKIINQSLRLAECIVHRDRFSHGFRLHPPHLWDIRDGIIYKKVNNKFVKFMPDFEKNIKLVEESKKENN
jgi:hypothetical protein